MSLFQCENCGCVENTALSSQGFIMTNFFDWSGIEDRKSKRLCSSCGPSKYANGKPTGKGGWHNEFDRVFLPLGEFITNKEGNLEHKKTGSTNFKDFII